MSNKKIKEKNSEKAENPFRYKKGQSGNPKGRPLGLKNFKTIFYETIEKIAVSSNQNPDDIERNLVTVAIKRASSGDYRFYQDLMDRIHGKATQTVDLNNRISTLSEEEQEDIDSMIDNIVKKTNSETQK